MPTIANYILSIFTWSRKQFKKYFPGKTETQSPENQTSFRESILEPVKCWITPLWKYKEPSKLQTTVVCPKTSQCLLTFWIHNKSFWITKVTSAKFFFDQTGRRSAVQGFFWPLCLWNTSSHPASLQGCVNEWCMNENHTVHSVVKKNDSILQAVTATQNWCDKDFFF